MPLRWTSAALGCVLLSVSITSAAERLRVVVSELDANGVSAQVSRVVSDHLRVKLIETRRFIVPEREKMEAVIAEQSIALSLVTCTSQECAIELGRLLQANKMVVGSVALLNQTYSISLRFLDLETGAAEFSAEEKCQVSDDLFVAAERLAARIAASIPLRGKVTAVGGDNIIIDLGADDGVSTGMQFRVFRPVERVQGYPEEEQIGLASVTSFQPSWSRVELQRTAANLMRLQQLQINDIVVGIQSVTVTEIPQYAYLMVYSRPVGAEVYVDNLFSGRTKEAGLEVRLSAGRHTVRVSAPAHSTEQREVELRANERKPFNATLQPRLRRIPFGMQIASVNYVRERPSNESFRNRLENERLDGVQVGAGRIYSLFMSQLGGSWTHANMAARKGSGINEVHRLTGYAQGGLSPRMGSFIPYVGAGYEIGRLYFNEHNVYDGSENLGEAGKIGHNGWYWSAGIYVGKWLHIGYRRTINRPETDIQSYSIGVNFAGP